MASSAGLAAPLLSAGTRNGTIGFFSSLGFLGFVGWFNEKINTYKTEKGLTKGKKGPAKPAKDLSSMLRNIFTKACGRREAWTVAALSTSLLLRTLGSVWVAKHWGRIVGAIVSRKWGALKGHMAIFAVATVFLAFLNAFLKYYITLLKEHVRQKLTNWCHKQLLRPGDMIYYKANTP